MLLVFFDKCFVFVDIVGLFVYVNMFVVQKIISVDDLVVIECGMVQIKGEIECGEFEWQFDLEDVYLNIEVCLIVLIGDVGKCLYMGCLCNDQVVIDICLWLCGEIDCIGGLLNDLCGVLIDFVEQNVDMIMLGFMYLQVVQFVMFGYYLFVYVEMFMCDVECMCDCCICVNCLLFGVVVFVGMSYLIDCYVVVKMFGFDGICVNLFDVVFDCDFVIEFMVVFVFVMMYVLCFFEEFVLWMSLCVGFIDIVDCFCIGSLIMLQKKNLDVFEFVCGKIGCVNGYLMVFFMLMKGQLFVYNKDNQEDKELLFDMVDIVVDMLWIFVEMVVGIIVKLDVMCVVVLQGFLIVIDFVDYFVKCGLLFCDVYEVVVYVVKICDDCGIDFVDLMFDEMKQELLNVVYLIGDDVFGYLMFEGLVVSCNYLGGIVFDQVCVVVKVVCVVFGK